jgi:hypothetical protein
MQRLKEMNVLVDGKIVKRYVYLEDALHGYVRMSKRWYRVAKAMPRMRFQWIREDQLTEIEAHLLEERMEGTN